MKPSTHEQRTAMEILKGMTLESNEHTYIKNLKGYLWKQRTN